MRIIPASLLLPLLLLGCGKEPAQVAFSGTWDLVEENNIAGTSDKVEASVDALPPKFRIVTRTETSETTAVYDGQSLHQKYVYIPGPYDGEAPPPSSESSPMTPERAASMRFWAQDFGGSNAPGGLVAGRDSVLYEGKVKRRDGEFSSQVWVDAEHKLVLKNIQAIYSSQINQLVRRSLSECKSIDYTPPADALFAKP